MSDEKLAFLDIPRDDKGRFAPKESDAAPPPMTLPLLEAEKEAAPPQPEPAPQAPPAPPAAPAAPPQTEPPGHIPIAALLDEREKRQKLERELAEYRRKQEEAARPAPTFDPIADPDGFTRSIQEQQAKLRQDTLFETSWLVAMQQHGEDAVQAAEKWLEDELAKNPGFYQTIVRQRHPYDFVVKQHKRSLSVAKLGEDDFETAARKWAEANGYSAAQPQPAPGAAAPIPQPGTPLPKPSIASVPSAGGSTPKVPMGPGTAFAGVFKS